jgi:hypothetical protein
MSTKSDRLGGANDGMASRGLLLLGVLVALGFLVLWRAFDGGGDGEASVNGNATSSSVAVDGAASTAAPGGTDTTTATTVAATPTTAAPVVSPADVRFITVNAAGIGGLARTTADTLSSLGYTRVDATNGNVSDAATSFVYFQGENKAHGDLVAQALTIPLTNVQPIPSPPPIATVPADVTVVVYLGLDRQTT